MKKTIFTSIAIILITIISCSYEGYEVTKSPEYPYQRLWAKVICGNVLDYKEETPKEWRNKVLDTLETRGFNIEIHHLGFIEQESFIGCGNCRLTGDYLDVIVPEEERENLKKLGFSE